MEAKTDAGTRIERVVSWINRLMRNKTVIALLLLVDGIMFIVNPQGGITGLGQGVALSVLVASAAILVAAVPEKPKTRRTKLSICAALFAAAVAAVFYFWPDVLSSVLVYLLALFLISNGIFNMLHKLKLDYLIGGENAWMKKKSLLERGIRGINGENQLAESVEQGIQEQFAKKLDPLRKVISRLRLSTALSLIVDLASVAAGVLILFQRDKGGAEFMRICGIGMIIAAVSDLWIILQAWLAKRKQKDSDI